MKAYRGLPLTHNRVRTATKPILFLVFLLSLFVYLIPSNAVAAASDNFITVWNTENDGDSITFPGVGTYTIDWGDGGDLESALATTPSPLATPLPAFPWLMAQVETDSWMYGNGEQRAGQVWQTHFMVPAICG